MKTTFIVLGIVLVSTMLKSQYTHHAIGITIQPSFFRSYNQNDWNNMPRSFPDNPVNFNGLSFGLAYQLPLNDIFSISFNVLYGKETQYHNLRALTRTDGMSGEVEYVYGNRIETSFKQLRLPIYLRLEKEITHGSGLFISIYGGAQISYLLNYNSRHYNYRVFNNQVLFDSLKYLTILEPGSIYQSIWEDYPEPGYYREVNYQSEDVYAKINFGVSAGFEILKVISDVVTIGIGARYEYDITNSESRPDLTFPQLGYVDRPSTHNIRVSTVLTVSYLLN